VDEGGLSIKTNNLEEHTILVSLSSLILPTLGCN